MGNLNGRTALVTGAAQGQGRAHALRLARGGAAIVAIDICDQIEMVSHEMGTSEDLATTVRLVEEAGGRVLAREADVRDLARLEAVVAEAEAELGTIDIVVANAGISSKGRAWELDEEAWQTILDVDLTGVWHTAKATIPSMIAAGHGGSIAITSSSAAFKSYANLAHYNSAKYGVLGLMKSLAIELAEHMIRVNAVCPGTVGTKLFLNDYWFRLFRPDLENPTEEDIREPAIALNAMPIPWVEPEDVANAVAWLASSEARYVTGVALPVDGGATLR